MTAKGEDEEGGVNLQVIALDVVSDKGSALEPAG